MVSVKIPLLFILSLVVSSSIYGKRQFNEIVYGRDDRVNPKNIELNAIEEAIVRNTMGQVSVTSVVEKEGRLFLKGASLKDERKLCDGENFANEKVVTTCSGFLITPQIVLSAGHCMRSKINCINYLWVSDVFNNDETNEVEVFEKNIYRCKEIITQKNDKDTGVDYSLILLDREVENFSLYPLIKREKGTYISDSANVRVSGFPSGIPMKLAGPANIIENSNKKYFSTNLDTFTGNSGSIVFNEDGTIEGVLVRGNTDYVKKTFVDVVTLPDGTREQKSRTCQVVNKVPEFNEADEYEEIVRLTEIEELYYSVSDIEFISLIKEKMYEQAFELLTKDININVRDLENGKTPLHYLIKNEASDEYIRLFLERRPKINIRDYKGDSVLFIALESESDDLLELIHESPIDLEKIDQSGKSIMHKLVEINDLVKIQKLVRVGVSIETRDESGDTPLLTALKVDNPLVGQFLIENGADVNARNNNGKNTIRLAIDSFNIEMLEYFISKGAKPSRGVISWLKGENDYTYIKNVIKSADNYDSIQLETLKKMKKIIEQAD